VTEAFAVDLASSYETLVCVWTGASSDPKMSIIMTPAHGAAKIIITRAYLTIGGIIVIPYFENPLSINLDISLANTPKSFCIFSSPSSLLGKSTTSSSLLSTYFSFKTNS
jgi:hypothetical protein